MNHGTIFSMFIFGAIVSIPFIFAYFHNKRLKEKKAELLRPHRTRLDLVE
jgi:cytochrome c biogenesis protein CcdA